MDDPRRYMRAMIFIRDRIENGTFKPHELIPSIQQLADQTGHSRHTLSKALRLLQDEGLVARTPGLGYVAKAPAPKIIGRPAPVTAVNGLSGSVGWGQGGAGHGRH